ncbi:uncharacterized protein Z518_09223 [Rhinocladiella mackenziei CBS 650.93]|uniref:Rhinocladiella mackenziei CBS 650.93 unplaced genomic scaffold supercont1.7, whole genome shotgun sequence n=1 Tax=Rhinocladiella mackenziei CBS 650.93 TaxID=1442369 RepID=A0A0D2FHR2_9EURO|nr:uncharacterized protein Z518_09223 [Rhinocladiella mackenziei CBS 650.93]KIX01497.1 hypothetical protein Z518_09223 [Rhinocladiella mackenziei CBS 650.93]
MAQDWRERAHKAVDTGPAALRDFLRLKGNDPRDDQAVDLLDYIHTQGRSSGLQNLYNVLFDAIRTPSGQHRDRFQATQGQNDRTERERRRRPWHYPGLSLYGVFKLSMDNDVKNALGSNKTPTPSTLTWLIWENAKEELYCSGAIIACATSGFDILLQEVVEKLKETLEGRKQEQLEILFQTLGNSSSDFTALGSAIVNRTVNCFSTLCFFEGAAEYILSEENVVTGSGQREPLLHWTLQQISARLMRESFVNDGNDTVSDEDEKLMERIIALQPRLLTQHNAEGLPPYIAALNIQEALRTRSGASGYQGLSQIIRDGIHGQLKDPDDWRRALYPHSDLGKEVSLDLSDFNYGSHYFSNFVSHLEEFKDRLKSYGKKWEFEETLLYLILPNLPKKEDHAGLAKFLYFLKEKNVNRIVKLKLPDSRGLYTHQFVHQHILSLFEIDEFDWVRLDVALDGFGANAFWTHWLKRVNSVPFLNWPSESPTPKTETTHLRSIHLYSNDGKFSDNLIAFKAPKLLHCMQDLQKIHLNLVEPKDKTSFNQEQAMIYRDSVRQDAGHWNGGVTFTEGERILSWKEFSIELESSVSQVAKEYVQMLSDPQLATDRRRFKFIKDLTVCRDFLSSFHNMKSPLDSKTRHCYRVFTEQRVKIAIIDTGADQMEKTLSGNIVRGVSFVRSAVEPHSVLPWFTPGHPHGTQMADLIRSVNPECELFPIRVASMRKDVDIYAATEAIDWAIENEIDIISISWIIKLPPSGPGVATFKGAVKRATNNNILVICATADIGAHISDDTWPANCHNVIAISASNAFGLPMPWSHRNVHAMLDGDQIKTRGPSYMGLDENAYESGSSVATALASGLASLCLFLARMANEDGKGERFKDQRVMKVVFRTMQENDTDKVVELSKFFDNSFRPPVGFQRGHQPPPDGLTKLHWSKFEDLGSKATTRRPNSPLPDSPVQTHP